MLQIAPPSREKVDTYQEIRANLDSMSGRINGEYSDIDWTPIRYVNQGFPRDVLAGVYRASRIGLEPLLARDLHRLADQYVAQGELQSAEPLYKRALQINQRALGEGHLRNARTLLQLGDLYRHLALYALAAPQYREALRLLSAAPDTGSVMREDVRARLAGLPSPGDDTP